jgi:hypothetical protein
MNRLANRMFPPAAWAIIRISPSEYVASRSLPPSLLRQERWLRRGAVLGVLGWCALQYGCFGTGCYFLLFQGDPMLGFVFLVYWGLFESWPSNHILWWGHACDRRAKALHSLQTPVCSTVLRKN